MAEAEYHKLHALIVDDFDSFRVTVSNMLQDIGIQYIDSAVNGADALRHCKNKSYDLILCDHNLGKGKTGQQVLEDLRENGHLNRYALFVLISAESSKSIIMAAYDYEPDAYLTKPITTKALQQRLSRLFAQRTRMLPIMQAMDNERWDVAEALCLREINGGGRYANQCQKLLGQLYIQTGAYEKAEAVYRDVLDVRQLDWAQVGMARVKKMQGDLVSAQQWLEEVMNTNPLCMKAYDLQAEIYREQHLHKRLQEVLQQTVEISPLSILRQQQLGDVAMLNNDAETAANAYRRTVRLGENSFYDRLENHIGFARATLALFREDKILAKPLLREAIKTMAELEQRFTKSPEEKIEALLIEAQLYASNGETRKAEELLQAARNLSADLDILPIAADIELVRAFVAVGQKNMADELTRTLLERYKGSERDLEKLDALLEEPASEKNRSLVAAINKKGIACYEASDYEAAIQCFEDALQTFPNHIGIRLNLVQALVDKLKIEADAASMDLAIDTLAQVEGKIVAAHDQYRRFRQLQEMLRNLDNNRRR
ncbi:MAG TPA: response regulator [Cellvibrio sp.]|nr:response regulator [Cellvibrio sp.]